LAELAGVAFSGLTYQIRQMTSDLVYAFIAHRNFYGYSLPKSGIMAEATA
jgi:hypothetical protein